MADVAQGTILQYGDGSANYASIAQVTSISGPSFSNPTIDVSDLDDTAREKISSKLVDCGQVTLSLNFDARTTSVHDLLVDRITAGTGAANFVICWSNIDSTTGEATISAVDGVAEIITTAAAHGLHTGQPIKFTTTGNLPTGLEVGTTYYAGVQSPTQISVHATNAHAVADSNYIGLTEDETGTNKITMASKVIFPAIVTDASPTANLGEALTGTMTLDVTGAVTITI